MDLEVLGSGLNLLERSKQFGFNLEVGSLQPEVVAQAGTMKLLRFSKAASKAPLLIVPSLINRFYILDLMPEKSFLRHLCEHFSVYLIDWGEPQAHGKDLSLNKLLELHLDVLYSTVLLEEEADRAHIVGHCLGGTMGLLWSLLHPEKVASLSLITTPIDFSADCKIKTWAQTQTFDLAAFREAHGNAPSLFLQTAFHSMRPLQFVQKIKKILPQLQNQKTLERFLALETWSSDSRDLPGGCYADLVQRFFRDNCWLNEGYQIAGETYFLKDLRVPVSAISAEDDHIVAFAGTLRSEQVPLVPQFQHWVTKGGHVGGLLGKSPQEKIWPLHLQWLQQQDHTNVRLHSAV